MCVGESMFVCIYLVDNLKNIILVSVLIYQILFVFVSISVCLCVNLFYRRA